MSMRTSLLSIAAASALLAGAAAPAAAASPAASPLTSSPASPARSSAPAPAAHGASGGDHARSCARRALPDVIDLPVGFRPEGITSRGRTFYAGSLADGRIWRGDLCTGRGSVLLAGQEGRQLRGMQVDRRTGLLWVAGNEGTTAVVLAVDARNGDIEHRYVVEGAAFLNDLVITRRAVWVTDSRVDRLTRIPLGRAGHPAAGPLRFLPLRGDWPAAEGIRANGIRQLPDGALVVVNSATGGLFAVSPRTGVAREIRVQGGPEFTGGDGLELRGRRLYVVRGTGQNVVSVVRLHRSGGRWTATWRGELTDPALDVPSTATFALGRLWAVNARFGVPSPATAAFAVVQLPARPR